MLTFHEAETMMRRARNGSRRLGNNTYLHPVPYEPDAYTVRFHATDVVTVHRDGTYTLRTGGWDTITTKARINSYSPARVYSERGVLAVWDRGNDPRTPPKIRNCRTCRGAGRVSQPAQWKTYEHYPSYRRIFPPELLMPAYWAKCWHCSGTGLRDYGSKPMPVIFFDGIRVDSHGSVVGADRLARLREPAEVTAARVMKAQRNVKRDFIREHGLTAQKGAVIMFKAVHDDLMSDHGARYSIGATVTADDYAPTHQCGEGLHFSPTPRMALSYSGSATRFLACAVDRPSMIVLDDKVKARSCRVLYEVDEGGSRLQPEPAPEPEITWGSYGYRE